MQTLHFNVDAACGGMRIDAYLAQCEAGLTRSGAQQLLTQGLVLCAGKPAAKSTRVAAGDSIEVTVPAPKESALFPQDIPLQIVYEDDALLIVNKPKGMVVHPAPGNPDGTLVNALLHHCAGSLSAINGEVRPGIVHRIDKDTSGLLVVAKDNETHLALSEQFAAHSITRVYAAIAYGRIREDGVVEKPIGRHPVDRKRMAITEKNSRYACTMYHVEEHLRGFTRLSVTLKTGRTHQIRVHLASIGHPVAGDAVYGPKKVLTQLQGQCLHAQTLGFIHPKTGEYVEFTSELPPYFMAFLKTLPKDS